MGLVRLVR